MTECMVDVAVYGHLTHDLIFENFEEKNTLGAMANFWYGLTKSDYSIKLKLVPSSIGKAIILVDKKTSMRIGRGDLNIHTRTISPVKSKWHHIMYLNQLKDCSFIDNIKDGVLSADITAGPPPSLELLSKLDYLFISDEDLFMEVQELSSIVKGWVIMHHSGGSICSDGSDTFETKTGIIENLNVLGAGDMFAASFISKKVTECNSLVKKCVEYAHTHTTEILLGVA